MEKFLNFNQPFTPRTKLGSARNFGKTRFGRFATFHFSTPKICLENLFPKNFRNQLFFHKNAVLEELWIFNSRWQMRLEKSLPELPLFLGRLPWRRGKWLNMCFQPRLGTKNDFNHLGGGVWRFNMFLRLRTFEGGSKFLKVLILRNALYGKSKNIWTRAICLMLFGLPQRYRRFSAL